LTIFLIILVVIGFLLLGKQAGSIFLKRFPTLLPEALPCRRAPLNAGGEALTVNGFAALGTPHLEFVRKDFYFSTAVRALIK